MSGHDRQARQGPGVRRIVVEASTPANAQLRTLVHETTHALGVDHERYSRPQAEVIADTVTFVVSSGVGLAVSGETIPYVAGWGEDAPSRPSRSSPARSTRSLAASRTPWLRATLKLLKPHLLRYERPPLLSGPRASLLPSCWGLVRDECVGPARMGAYTIP